MSKSKNMKTPNPSQFIFTSSRIYDDDDDFQNPIPSFPLTQTKPSSSQKLKLSSFLINRPSKKPKKTQSCSGKENLITPPDLDLGLDLDVSLESIEPTVLCNKIKVDYGVSVTHDEKKKKINDGFGYLSNSIESRLLLGSRGGGGGLVVCENACEKVDEDEDKEERFEGHQETGTTQLDVLLDLCCSSKEDEIDNVGVGDGDFISCPMCGSDISNMSDEMREVHTNECLDKEQTNIPDSDHVLESPGQVLDDPPCLAPGPMDHISPISAWLQNLGLSRYEEVFCREEVDWDSLKWLTDEVGQTS